MAFFKFRLPGRVGSDEALASASPAESLEALRRRARQRLMGAAVLVLLAVVGFPLLFDTQPRPVAVDTPILIPDRDSTPPLTSAKPKTRPTRISALTHCATAGPLRTSHSPALRMTTSPQLMKGLLTSR